MSTTLDRTYTNNSASGLSIQITDCTVLPNLLYVHRLILIYQISSRGNERRRRDPEQRQQNGCVFAIISWVAQIFNPSAKNVNIFVVFFVIIVCFIAKHNVLHELVIRYLKDIFAISKNFCKIS